MNRPEHVSRLDARVKGVAILVKSPVLRTTARWLVALCDPPAPVKLVKDEAAALEAARSFGARDLACALVDASDDDAEDACVLEEADVRDATRGPTGLPGLPWR